MPIRALLNTAVWVALIYAGVYGLQRFYGTSDLGPSRQTASDSKPVPVSEAGLAPILHH